MSAILGYLLGPGAIIPFQVLLLCLGGFLITGASNAFNQIWERDLDKLMIRTQNRPLPLGKITVFESALVGVLLGITGVFILWLINDTCAVLGILALVLYVADNSIKDHYAISSFCWSNSWKYPAHVRVYCCFGNFGLEAGVLFMIRFLAALTSGPLLKQMRITKAGFRLLPRKSR